MINLRTAITSALDALGIHLDAESFENLMYQIRIDKLPWKLKLALAVIVSVGVEYATRPKEGEQENG